MKGQPDWQILQRLWLQQLELEFDEICLTCNLYLEPPVFEITEARKQLGAWCPGTRTLRLSCHLIRNHSWSVTLQVLKHEMAHQLCSETMEYQDGGHGQSFQDACERLGVLPEYRFAGAVMADVVEQAEGINELSARGRGCLARVEKLLALSHSSNEHEAALAMQKARELIEKHHLDQLGRDRQHRYSFSIIDRKRKRIEGYQRRICTILQEFFFVRVVLASLYDPLACETYKTIELMGTRENVAIAEYCYHFLENRLASLWSMNKQRFNGSTRIEKNSYYFGLLSGFYDKLQAQKERTPVKGEQFSKPLTKANPAEVQRGELVIAEEKRLEAFVGIRFPRLKKSKKSGARVYRNTYREGRETGKSICFSEGLTGERQGVRGLLPE